MSTLLEFKNLCRYFEGEQGRYVMESGTLSPGGVLVFKGPSGAGKSTLLKTIARLIKPQGGEVYLQDRDWWSYSSAEWRGIVQYVAQKPVMFSGSLEDNIRLPFTLKFRQGQMRYDRDQAQALLEKLNVPSHLFNQAAATLSGGEASRMALVRAMLIEPRILLLDEPTAYLDGDNRLRAMEVISDWVKDGAERGVIMVSHNEEDLESLSGVSVLNISAREEA